MQRVAIAGHNLFRFGHFLFERWVVGREPVVSVRGFDQKYAEQVFLMFTRLHQDKSIEGTGIGLALCKKIVEEHNGFISARSKINEGSTFIVSLPLHAQKAHTSSVRRR